MSQAIRAETEHSYRYFMYISLYLTTLFSIAGLFPHFRPCNTIKNAMNEWGPVNTYSDIFESATIFLSELKIPRPRTFFVADLLFSTLESAFKNYLDSPDACVLLDG